MRFGPITGMPRDGVLGRFLRASPLCVDLATGLKTGRPKSIPRQMWGTVFEMYSKGHGYRAIANLLVPLGVSTAKSSVERLIRGQGCYVGMRPSPEESPAIEVGSSPT